MIDEKDSKKGLEEVGTRYSHYMELKEVFMTGIEVIKGMNPNYLGDSDNATLVKLQGAVEVINKQLEFLSDYEKKTVFFAELPKTLRDIENARRRKFSKRLLLTDGKHHEQAKEDIDQCHSTENSQEPPAEPTGV